MEQIITIDDKELQTLATILRGEVVTAQPGAFTLGKQYTEGQVAVIQRTIHGVASESLAKYVRHGSTWQLLKSSDEARVALDTIRREH